MKDLFAKCGVNCSRCPWSRSVRNPMTDEEYQQVRDRCKQVLGYRPTEAYQNCLGCKTPDEEIPKEARIPLRNCLVRKCVDKTGIENCACCSRFPCGYIKDSGREWSRKKIEAKHGAPIPEEDYLTFIEPFEGLKHLEEIRASLKSEDIVEARKVPPLKTKIVEFPKDLLFPEEETSAFRTLHGMLASVKRSSLGLTDTDTFAQQARLKNRMPHFLRFLWIFGRFGEFKEENGSHLVVEAKAYIDNRGKEKNLAGWSYVEKVIFTILSEFGVHCERIVLDEGKKKGAATPTGYLRDRGWLMKMSFGESAVGEATLKALQTYTRNLDEKYGKKAFRYFSDADMSVLKEK